ncbi:MAG: hypothetical protein ACN6RH_05850 [Stenotrophomonas rhizophila]|uniref:hypothetical protein n=1 Tax=Stenotrophomonas rhizophila TaxID=216778 RepID=UPI003D14F5D7
MSLFVAGRSILHPHQLSPLGQRVLSLLDGGVPWVQWAMASTTQRYAFGDEGSLLDGVQQGLHGARMAWLPQAGLQIGPVKLLSLGQEDIDTLCRIEAGEDDRPASLRFHDLLSRHALLTNTALQAYRPFLASIGVADAPLFQQLDFHESLALCQLSSEQGTAMASDAPSAEAAGFALANARRPSEFCDYYRFYRTAPHTADSAEQRRLDAMYTLQLLLPNLFEMLDGAQLTHLPAPEEVDQAINATLASGRTVGFARISLAAQQLSIGLPPAHLGEQAVAEHARCRMRDVQALLGSHRVHSSRLGQDGASMHCLIEGKHGHAAVQVEDNSITLARYSCPGIDDARYATAGNQAHQTTAAPAQPARPSSASPSPSPDGARPMSFPTPPPSPPEAHLPHKSQMEIAQELVAAAMAATDEAVRRAMAVSQHAVEAANEAARCADAAAEEAVRRAHEAAAGNDARPERHR